MTEHLHQLIRRLLKVLSTAFIFQVRKHNTNATMVPSRHIWIVVEHCCLISQSPLHLVILLRLPVIHLCFVEGLVPKEYLLPQAFAEDLLLQVHTGDLLLQFLTVDLLLRFLVVDLRLRFPVVDLLLQALGGDPLYQVLTVVLLQCLAMGPQLCTLVHLLYHKAIHLIEPRQEQSPSSHTFTSMSMLYPLRLYLLNIPLRRMKKASYRTTNTTIGLHANVPVPMAITFLLKWPSSLMSTVL